MARPSVHCPAPAGAVPVRLLLVLAMLPLLASGCGLEHYEQQMESEQKRLKYFDAQNQNLEGSPLKLPEKKAEDKEAVADKDFFFRPPKGIATTPDPKAIGIFHRYPSTDPNGTLQDLLVAVVKVRESTERFRSDVLQNLQSLGLRPVEPLKSRDAGAPIGRPVHYDFYELQGPPNQPGGYVYFFHESLPGEGDYQAALAFRGTPASPAGIANENPVMELTLGSLRVGNAARLEHSRFRPLPPPGRWKRR